MSLQKQYDFIVASECRNTHHKLVMNALNHLQCPHAPEWFGMFVQHFEHYLQGSKDPDTKFRDFKNHVLHVSDNFWGGPVAQAERWYASTVSHLKSEQWRHAVYSAGVLSHYFMDPFMPLHTGQTEEEGVVHRACEWSINKSFCSLIEQLENTTGYPKVKLPNGEDWLKQAIHNGSKLAHAHYNDFIDHYNLELGKSDPPAGLDDLLREVSGQLLGYASVGFARVLERAFDESGAVPVARANPLKRIFYGMTHPMTWLYRGWTHQQERRQVQRIAREYQAKGKVIHALPADEKQVRRMHAAEVLIVELAELDQRPIGDIGSKFKPSSQVKPDRRSSKKKPKRIKDRNKEDGTPESNASTSRSSTDQSSRDNRSHSAGNGDARRRAAQRKLVFRLELTSPLEQAPSIGPKTARRFEDVGICSVGDFLETDPDEIELTLNTRHITSDRVRQWQTQTRLACQIPGIHGHDAQILAGCGFESPAEIADAEPEMILSLVDEYTKTEESRFVIRDGKLPDKAEVINWVEWARHSRNLDAA